MRRALVAVLAFALAAPAGAAAAPASLPTIERQVMCVTCKIPLMVAQSPQADREREYIRGLIAQGHDEGQIKSDLVEQYGPTVLALPAAHGFDLAAYLVPAAVVAALAGLSGTGALVYAALAMALGVLNVADLRFLRRQPSRVTPPADPA